MTFSGPLQQLADTGEIVAGYLERARPLAASTTPCAPWSVTELANHLVLGKVLFVGIVEGRPRPDLSADYLGDDWVGAQRDSLSALVAALDQPGVLTTTYRAPAGEVQGTGLVTLRAVEEAVHGWDLAVATGTDPAALNDVAADLVGPTQVMLGRLPELATRRPFAEPVAVTDSVQPIDRLVALLGRDPGWRMQP